MNITIKIPEGSKWETIIRKMIEDKKTIREELRKGNRKIYEEKGYRFVKPI